MPSDDRLILLGRHGETEWNRIGRWQGATDIPLSDVGRDQARALGARLVGAGIARVYASTLIRARETAEIVVAALALNGGVVVDARLRERGYGCFEGLTREECAARHPDVWERYLLDRRMVPPDAEPQDQILDRMTAAINDVAASTDAQGAALVISHGGVIRTFIHGATGVVLPPLGNGDIVRLRIGNAGVFRVVGASSRARPG